MSSPRVLRASLYVLFTVSGFAGLIYESIWTHYLKLFLGHAAYAQTLVLAIFMGGMAIGAWAAGRFSSRLGQPLLAYAAVELVIGIAALLFDGLFRHAMDWMFDQVLPSLPSPWVIDVVKWSFAAIIILPQSILLGTTFPLMSAGVVRTAPAQRGHALAVLYFTNSLGAAAGVLASGFWLISRVGLPGTILTAGLLNVSLAIVVFAVARRSGEPTAPAPAVTGGSGSSGMRLMYVAALVTGAASFFYEIAWIRMLSLVLGAATHSFELMLAAFILGLAIGSFIVRNRADRWSDLRRALGIVQLVMALLAAATVLTYHYAFDYMAVLLKALARTDAAYALFNLSGFLLCLLVMLPATICAGMTLPLITTQLLRQGVGESAIGRVYAWNTLGAIIGIVLAVHWCMPYFGLKWVVLTGSALDLALGCALLASFGLMRAPPIQASVAAGLAMLTLAAIAAFVNIDPRRTASGVFRYGITSNAGDILFHRDGKTATVHVTREYLTQIWTNGKVDAGLRIDRPEPGSDDPTMVLAGALPLLLTPDARRIAVIGMGSGRTTHTLLLSPNVERVDTIEIEPAMVDGARLFGPAVERTFADPRSAIHLDDAKTYFARAQQTYDVIVSEPSNPWVSGVASLFSEEFYRRTARHLNAGGLFVQWIQLYEIELGLVVSILKALSAEFEDFVAFSPGNADLIVIARRSGAVPPLDPTLLSHPPLAELLAAHGAGTLADAESKRVAGSMVLRPFIATFQQPANSDYFPFVDQRAVKARFQEAEATSIYELRWAEALLAAPPQNTKLTHVPKLTNAPSPVQAMAAAGFLAAYRAGADIERTDLAPDLLRQIIAILSRQPACGLSPVREAWLSNLVDFLDRLGPFLPAQAFDDLREIVADHPCVTAHSPMAGQWLDAASLLGQRNYSALWDATPPLLQDKDAKRRRIALEWAMAAGLRTGRAPQAYGLFKAHVATAGTNTLRTFAGMSKP